MLKIQNEIDLPPLGPGWAGAVMGLGISSTLIDVHVTPLLGPAPSKAMLGAATILAISLAFGFLKHHNPGFYAADMPAWGMVSMGILSLGSAYSLIYLSLIHI